MEEGTLQQVTVQQVIPHEASTVWQLTGNFGGLKNWLPGVTECSVSGKGPRDQGGDAERAVHLMDGSVTRESLESLDESQMYYRYAILEAKGFKADQQFIATFQVMSLADGQCEVVWTASFSVPEAFPAEKIVKARQQVSQMYQFFLTHLTTLLVAD